MESLIYLVENLSCIFGGDSIVWALVRIALNCSLSAYIELNWICTEHISLLFMWWSQHPTPSPLHPHPTHLRGGGDLFY